MPEFRIPGLSSGMDMNENVQKLMDAERAKTNTWNEKQTLLQWEQSQYNTVIDKYSSFVIDARESFDMSTNFVGHVNSETSDFLQKSVVSSDANVRVDASSKALEGQQTINVTQKANGVTMASNETISVDSSATNVVNRFGIADATSKVIAFTINGEEFDYSDLANTSLDKIIKDVNDKDLGVRMSYDSNLDRVFIQTTETGSDAAIEITNGTTLNPASADTLNFLTSTDTADGLLQLDTRSGNRYAGENAIIEYKNSGNTISTMEFQSNNFTVNEITYDVSNATLNSDITINVTENEMGIYDKVEEFVKKYNTMNKFIQGKLTEKRDRTKSPLTEDDKEKMTNNQIDKHTLDAQKGLLTNSSILTSIQSSLRISLIETVKGSNGDLGNLSSIGINMSKDNTGNLEIDEASLRKSISDDPTKVMEILFKKPETNAITYEKNLSSAEVKVRRSESGIFNRMTDIVANGLVTLTNKAGKEHEDSIRKVNSSIIIQTFQSGGISSIDQELARVSTKLEELETYLSEREDYYWSSFSRMESSMTNLNSQMMWLESQGM